MFYEKKEYINAVKNKIIDKVCQELMINQINTYYDINNNYIGITNKYIVGDEVYLKKEHYYMEHTKILMV